MKRRVRLFLAIFFALLLTAVFAPRVARADASIGVHMVSVHAPDPGLNNFNPGLFVQGSNGLSAGWLLNSYRRTTFYAGWETPEFARLSLFGGVGTGYKPHEAPQIWQDLSALGTINLRLHSFGNGMTLKLRYVPKFSSDNYEVFHLTLQQPL